ncbi:MAG: hypothetical protein KC609_23420 [Myxococcales bacterium]|nr:hypothetical protein [Myxococcales bacterium]
MKGLFAIGGLVGATLLWTVWWPLGIIGTGVALLLVYQWFSFRAKWGMKL